MDFVEDNFFDEIDASLSRTDHFPALFDNFDYDFDKPIAENLLPATRSELTNESYADEYSIAYKENCMGFPFEVEENIFDDELMETDMNSHFGIEPAEYASHHDALEIAVPHNDWDVDFDLPASEDCVRLDDGETLTIAPACQHEQPPNVSTSLHRQAPKLAQLQNTNVHTVNPVTTSADPSFSSRVVDKGFRRLEPAPSAHNCSVTALEADMGKSKLEQTFAEAKLAFDTANFHDKKRKLQEGSRFHTFKLDSKKPKTVPSMTSKQNSEKLAVRKIGACLLCRFVKRSCSSDKSISCARCIEWTKGRSDLGFTTCLRDHPCKFNPFSIGETPHALYSCKMLTDEGCSLICEKYTAVVNECSIGHFVPLIDLFVFHQAMQSLTDIVELDLPPVRRLNREHLRSLLAYTSTIIFNMLEDVLSRQGNKPALLLSNRSFRFRGLGFASFLYIWSRNRSILDVVGDAGEALKCCQNYLLAYMNLMLRREKGLKFKSLSHSMNQYPGVSVPDKMLNIAKVCRTLTGHPIAGDPLDLRLSFVSDLDELIETMQALEPSLINTQILSSRNRCLWERDWWVENFNTESNASETFQFIAVCSILWHSIPTIVRTLMDFTGEDFLGPLLEIKSKAYLEPLESTIWSVVIRDPDFIASYYRYYLAAYLDDAENLDNDRFILCKEDQRILEFISDCLKYPIISVHLINNANKASDALKLVFRFCILASFIGFGLLNVSAASAMSAQSSLLAVDVADDNGTEKISTASSSG